MATERNQVSNMQKIVDVKRDLRYLHTKLISVQHRINECEEQKQRLESGVKP